MKVKNKINLKINGKNLKIAIVIPYFNEELGNIFLENTIEELINNKVKKENIGITKVAGSLEIPFAAQRIIEKESPDAIIALGIIIRGETIHFDLVANTTHQGLMKVQLENRTPIAFGILACENLKQARERVSKEGLNKGAEIAKTALLQTLL